MPEYSVEERYKKAQYFMQGVWNKKIAYNTTLTPHWIGDTNRFWYEREHKQGRTYRLVDAKSGKNVEAFDHQRLGAALSEASGQNVSREDLPISKLEFSDNARSFTFDAFGERWLFDGLACSKDISLSSSDLISPDGQKVAFRRDDNIWIRNLKTGEETQITFDGEAHNSYGDKPAAWGHKQDTSGMPDALWSPDSTKLLTLQVDTRGIKKFPIIQHVPTDGTARPQIADASRSVALPGDTQVDRYRIWVINVEAPSQQAAFYKECPFYRNANGYFSVGNGWWGKDSRFAYFIDLDRGDEMARLVKLDTNTGHTSVVIEEASKGACFKLHLDSHSRSLIRPLPDRNEVIWYSERQGWAHLYLYDLGTGDLKKQLTQGDWLVRDIIRVDENRREVFVQTAGRVQGRNPYYRDVCRVDLETSELMEIVSTDHEYVVYDEEGELAANYSLVRDNWRSDGVAPTGDFVVVTRSRPDQTPLSLLLDRDGNEVCVLEEANTEGVPDGWQWPEPVKMTAADGETDIWGVIFRPSHFSPEKSYPVLDISWNHEEGCHYLAGSFTNNSLAGYGYLRPAAYAELGFVVVTIFGRGTACRHRAFSEGMAPWTPGSENQQDRIAGIKQLAALYPYMDLSRVGAGGGFMSTTVGACGVLGAPDFFKVGISDCAVLDYQVTPAFFGESYGASRIDNNYIRDIYSYAEELSGKLLLMHGMMDSSSPVASTLRLVEALQKANKDFDMLLLPNDGHSMSSYATRRAWDYLVDHLAGETPPDTFLLTTSIDLLLQEMYAKRAAASRKAEA